MVLHPALTPFVVGMVLGAGVLHAVWNAIAKQVDDRLTAFALIGMLSTVAGGATLVVTGLPDGAAVPYAVVSAGLHVVYDLALMHSYRLGAFNQTYPIARGTSPLVVAVGAYFLAHERLPGAALAGVVVLAGGLMSLALSSGRLSRADLPAVGAAVFTGLAIASYTLVDGLGVRRAHDPYAYAALLFLLLGPVFPAVVLVRRPLSVWRAGAVVRRGLVAGALTLAAYTIVLWAQTRAPLAEVAALRETSVISAALIGTLFLKERFGARRVTAAVLVATGIVLISA
ncbi:MAG TPA: DMT family transporter [Acidimicrobiales bacterium]|nr:DMT family transporter [Acidimicrobiales bacterium]